MKSISSSTWEQTRTAETNVARDPGYAEVRARMRSAMAAWMEQTGDFINAQWPG